MCPIILSSFLSGNDGGGHWLYAGFSTTNPGTDPALSAFGAGPVTINGTVYNQGDEVPAGTGTLDNPQAIDTTGSTEGFYGFTYQTIPGDTLADCGTANYCGDCATVVVEVVSKKDAGTDGIATYCQSQAVLSLFSLLGGTPDTDGNWALTSGNPGASAYTLSADDNGQNDTFNPQNSTEGNFVFTYTVTSTDSQGNVPACPDCTQTATVTITVVAAGNAGTPSTVTVCN